MKAIRWFVTLFVLCPIAASHAEDGKKDVPKQDDSIKCVVDHLEMTWGIKFKSMNMKETPLSCEFKITLEFTNDLSDVKIVQAVFAPRGEGAPADFNQCLLVFYLFDGENVSLNKYVIKSLEGELTGVKGDAFRVVLNCDAASVKKAKKLEARLRNAPKPK